MSCNLFESKQRNFVRLDMGQVHRFVANPDSLGPEVNPLLRRGLDARRVDKDAERYSDKVTLPLFRVALNPRFTRPFYAVPRTSVVRTASG